MWAVSTFYTINHYQCGWSMLSTVECMYLDSVLILYELYFYYSKSSELIYTNIIFNESLYSSDSMSDESLYSAYNKFGESLYSSGIMFRTSLYSSGIVFSTSLSSADWMIS